jgi:hypothetical protein
MLPARAPARACGAHTHAPARAPLARGLRAAPGRRHALEVAAAARGGKRGGTSGGGGGDGAPLGVAPRAAPPPPSAAARPGPPAAEPAAPVEVLPPVGGGDAAAAAPVADAGHQAWAWKGAKLGKVATAVGLGAALRYGVPVPEGLDPQARHLRGRAGQGCVVSASGGRTRCRRPPAAASRRRRAAAQQPPCRAGRRPPLPAPPPTPAPPPPRCPSNPQAWTLLSFFLTTVAGLVLEPVAAGAWALMCVGCALGLHALTFEEAFAAADSQVLWLIVNAFFLAKVG